MSTPRPRRLNAVVRRRTVFEMRGRNREPPQVCDFRRGHGRAGIVCPSGGQAPANPPAVVLADGEHRRHRTHSGIARLAGKAPAERRRDAVAERAEPGCREAADHPVPEAHHRPQESRQDAVLAECDFFLHGSGPGLVGRGEAERAGRRSGERGRRRATGCRSRNGSSCYFVLHCAGVEYVFEARWRQLRTP